jgi:hypothetical protein
MPIPLHLTLLFLANIAALLGGFMLGMLTHETIRHSLPDILQIKQVVFIVFGMLPAALALLVTGFVFRKLITGRCLKCQGRAIYHASRREKAVFRGTNKVPITYECQRCGYIHRTQVFSGGSNEHCD